MQILEPLAFVPITASSRYVLHVSCIHQTDLNGVRLQHVVQRNPPGRRWRTELPRCWPTVRRSNVVCGFLAPRFHKDALFCDAIEGISLTSWTNPYSP